MSVVTILFLK